MLSYHLQSSSRPQKSKRLRAPLSCDQCRSKKRKCDRQEPCGRCTTDLETCTHDRASRVESLARQRKRTESNDLQLQDGSHSISSSPNYNAESRSHIINSNSDAGTPSTSRISRMSNAWSSPRAPSDLFTAPSTVFSPGLQSNYTDSHSIFPLTKLIAKEPYLQILLHAPFFTRVMDMFLREIDWIMDLLNGTRLHLLVLTHPQQGLQACSPQLSESLYILALAVVSITSQMCPTEVQAVLLTTNWPIPLGEFINASKVASKSYHIATSQLNDSATGEPRTWPAEHFAASYILRVYEKNDGRGRNTKENLLIDLYRLQQAGFHRQPLPRNNHLEYPAEHNLLAYRLFWQYFDKDCVLSWFGKVGRVISTQRAKICLRDSFGHDEINHLCKIDNQLVISSCSCQKDQSIEEPILSAFVGGAIRLSAITSKFSDRTSRINSPSFKWPNDAEELAYDFDLELVKIEKDIEVLNKHSPTSFHHAQKEILSLSIAHARSELAKTLYEAFATNLFTQGTTSKGTIDGILQRRRLDTAMALIVKAENVTAKLASCSLSWIFCPMFVHEHVNVLLENITPLLVVNTEMMALPFQQLSQTSRQYLLKCIRHILLGRNLLVLLTRRNELARAKFLVEDVCSKVHSMLVTELLSGYCTESIEDTLSIVDEQAVMMSLEQRLANLPQSRSTPDTSLQNSSTEFSQSFLPVFEETLPNYSFDEEFLALFEDLPALSQLFQV